jgi:hypothetical protein
MADDLQDYGKLLHEKLAAISAFNGRIYAKADTLQDLSEGLKALSDACEQKMHADTKDRVAQVITKLEKDEDIGILEKDLIRTWLIGDATLFRDMEENYVVWMAELKHLLQKLYGGELRGVGLQEVLQIDARAKTAQCLVRDILMFIEQRDRAEHFEDDEAEWSTDLKLGLAKLLQAELDRFETVGSGS